MVEGGRFELPNPKEEIYSLPRLATSLPLQNRLAYLFYKKIIKNATIFILFFLMLNLSNKVRLLFAFNLYVL